MCAKNAISPTRAENYPEWYQQVITAADLAENSPVRGCMVVKPWGYGIWENLQQQLDNRLKATGHVNAYFPLLIPLSQIEKEASHIEGFAKECAVVTHHRLIEDGKGGLQPAGELEEPYVIRPTSETMFGSMYAKWIQSYRDLPVKINQWANVMRWEMRTRLFLRTSEFLWQEGHTAHATADEAVDETLMILDLYADFAEEVLALPVIKGEKTITERFPGASNTYCIEAMMQDGKALQAGTSHFLGQNFARAYDINYLNQDGELQHVWTTSWGVSTRLIGGVIMTHSDDDGLVLPPRIAPQHIVILPIYKDADRERVLNYCRDLQTRLAQQYYHHQPLRVHIDDRDLRGGEKNWQWVKRGAPIRLEIGPRDIDNDALTYYRRDQGAKERQQISQNDLVDSVLNILDDIQTTLFNRAQNYRDQRTQDVTNLEDFKAFFAKGEKHETTAGGFVRCYAVDSPEVEKILKPLKVSARCIPLEQPSESGTCIFTGEKVDKHIIFAKAY
ncbi:MAG: proline--tRNA ligase [Legionellales bacterium]|nr:proline--tRNA ligase [Legionellales bacterium]|tara:strand:+ start:13412 stop:14920 length:1509 start_codon:yes stop_codon:yes gene_type:complete